MQYYYWPSLLSICIKSTNAITIVWGNRGRSFLSIGKLSGVIHTKRAKSNKPQCFPYCNLHTTKVKILQFSRFNKFYVHRALSFSNFQLGQQHRVGLTLVNCNSILCFEVPLQLKLSSTENKRNQGNGWNGALFIVLKIILVGSSFIWNSNFSASVYIRFLLKYQCS